MLFRKTENTQTELPVLEEFIIPTKDYNLNADRNTTKTVITIPTDRKANDPRSTSI